MPTTDLLTGSRSERVDTVLDNVSESSRDLCQIDLHFPLSQSSRPKCPAGCRGSEMPKAKRRVKRKETQGLGNAHLFFCLLVSSNIDNFTYRKRAYLERVRSLRRRDMPEWDPDSRRNQKWALLR